MKIFDFKRRKIAGINPFSVSVKPFGKEPKTEASGGEKSFSRLVQRYAKNIKNHKLRSHAIRRAEMESVSLLRQRLWSEVIDSSSFALLLCKQ